MKVKKIHPDAKLPIRAESRSNGYDLFAVEDVFISVGTTAIVPTGIAIELDVPPFDELLTVFKIEDRSSMATKGLRTGAGVVDYSYRGEIKVVIHNLNNTSESKETGQCGYQIKKGDKIAQGLVYWTSAEDVEETNELNETDRGTNGWGSTGK